MRRLPIPHLNGVQQMGNQLGFIEFTPIIIIIIVYLQVLVEMGAQWLHEHEINPLLKHLKTKGDIIGAPWLDDTPFHYMTSSPSEISQCDIEKHFAAIENIYWNIFKGLPQRRLENERLVGPIFEREIANHLSEQNLDSQSLRLFHATKELFIDSLKSHEGCDPRILGVECNGWYQEGGSNFLCAEDLHGLMISRVEKFVAAQSGNFCDSREIIHLNCEIVSISVDEDVDECIVEIRRKPDTKGDKNDVCGDNHILEKSIYDHVIFTGSLNVMKRNHSSLFKDLMSPERLRSLNSLEMGIVEKIFLSLSEDPIDKLYSDKQELSANDVPCHIRILHDTDNSTLANDDDADIKIMTLWKGHCCKGMYTGKLFYTRYFKFILTV